MCSNLPHHFGLLYGLRCGDSCCHRSRSGDSYDHRSRCYFNRLRCFFFHNVRNLVGLLCSFKHLFDNFLCFQTFIFIHLFRDGIRGFLVSLSSHKSLHQPSFSWLGGNFIVITRTTNRCCDGSSRTCSNSDGCKSRQTFHTALTFFHRSCHSSFRMSNLRCSSSKSKRRNDDNRHMPNLLAKSKFVSNSFLQRKFWLFRNITITDRFHSCDSECLLTDGSRFSPNTPSSRYRIHWRKSIICLCNCK
mmetsp:Transcript_21567/g.30047  ORF Transcript_21567/g.30047 Transcript_21567/m.30047 type:complete len:246 (-) Transcript_21567:78-815(-)